MSYYADLRALTEAAVDTDTVLDILGRSGVESTVLLTKAATVFAKEMATAKATKDPEARLAILKQAKKDAVAMKKMANSIPPDGITDHTWRLITTPWWMNLYSYGKATAVKDETPMEMTKEGTIQKFDMIITYIDHEIGVCERKLNKGA